LLHQRFCARNVNGWSEDFLHSIANPISFVAITSVSLIFSLLYQNMEIGGQLANHFSEEAVILLSIEEYLT
jgi:hypothetical protein